MKVHFIAIAGSAMHNLALALHHKGYVVTGSDDEITEPAKSRLAKAGILPAENGWFAGKITANLDAVILGMHARIDNPELLKAQQLGLKVFSYPEYLYEQSKDKLRVVVGGSHGKTTITAMIMHVLKYHNINFDYMVGAQLEGFDTMVKVTADAPVIILEGDEYLSSPIDRRPKFHLYNPQLAIISGIAWDHINVFPTYENYVEQFKIFAQTIPANGHLVYCEKDSEVKRVCEDAEIKTNKIPYGIPAYEIRNGVTYLKTRTAQKEIALQVFGEHNLMNLNGARLVCNQLNITDDKFYEAIASFKGAARRLELLAKNEETVVYKDFAHSPSKLKATTQAVKSQYPNRKIIACMELHTFSSLNENFLDEYKGSMADATEACVYFNPHTIEHKKLKAISTEQVIKAFDRSDLKIFTSSLELKMYLLEKDYTNSVLLMMSSGTFDGMDLKEMAQVVTSLKARV